MDIWLYEKCVEKQLSPKRMQHTRGCVQTACELAEIWGADVEKAHVAALLHDITKEQSLPAQLKLCEKHDIIISDTQRKVPELLHAVTGAKLVHAEFSIPEDVCSAIRWHTTGKPDMTVLEKVIWLADLIEPGRDFPGVDEIREMARRDLDAALLMGFGRTIQYLTENKRIIDCDMIQAWNWLVG